MENNKIDESTLKVYEIWTNDYKKYDQLMWGSSLAVLLPVIFFVTDNSEWSYVETIVMIFLAFFIACVFYKHKKSQREIIGRMKKIENKYFKEYI